MSSKITKWWDENVKENETELSEMGELAARALADKLNIEVNPHTVVAYYAEVFNTIISVVKEQQKERSSFMINIANRLEVGYTTTDNEDDEKVGNFMVFIRGGKGIVTPKTDEEGETTISLATQWNASNVVSQADIIKDIASKATKPLKDNLDINLGSTEIIIPVFCIIHEQFVAYMRLKRVETNAAEFEVNVANLYTLGAREDEEMEEEIYYVPSISLKLDIKDDSKASSKYE